MRRKIIWDNVKRCTRFSYHATGREYLYAALALLAVAAVLVVVWRVI